MSDVEPGAGRTADPGAGGGRRFRVVASAVGPGALAAELVGDDVAAFLADPDGFLGRGETLKDDPPSRVVRLALGGRDVVVKRFRNPDARRALRRAFQRSRARRALAASALLAELGLAVPKPLGWLEARRGPIQRGSWWLAEFVAGREAPAAFADAAGDGVRLEALAGQLAEIVATLQRARVVHGDLKATNFLIPARGPPVLIDLHDARRVGRLGDRRLRRDRRRFRRNFLDPLAGTVAGPATGTEVATAAGAGTALGPLVDAALEARGVPLD